MKGKQLYFSFMTLARQDEVGPEQLGMRVCAGCDKLWPVEQMEDENYGPCCYELIQDAREL